MVSFSPIETSEQKVIVFFVAFIFFFCEGEIFPQVLRKIKQEPDEEEEEGEMPNVSTNSA